MKHRAFAPALGVLAAVFAVVGGASHAFAADPSGIWAKDDGSAKMEVKKCGRGICSKIVWLRAPEDSRGRPLHDARNENPSMRDRPILGLPLFINMMPIEANTWQGSVYNPEEGKIYDDVKVTLVSRTQIVLKGCKAWLLCGEKIWIKSKLPPSVVKPEEQEPIEVKDEAPAAPDEPAPPELQPPIDVKAPVVPEEPAAQPMPAPAPTIQAAREPVFEAAEPEPVAAAPLTLGTPTAATPVEAGVSIAPPKIVKSTVQRSAPQHNAVGMGLVTPAASPEPLPLSGDNVSSMMVMTRPAPAAEKRPQPEVSEPTVQSAAVEEDETPAPAPKPKARPKPRTQSADASSPVIVAPTVVKPKPKPREPEEVLPWLRPRAY
jgi:uncharacterized protein (DUF2147 family)